MPTFIFMLQLVLQKPQVQLHFKLNVDAYETFAPARSVDAHAPGDFPVDALAPPYQNVEALAPSYRRVEVFAPANSVDAAAPGYYSVDAYCFAPECSYPDSSVEAPAPECSYPDSSVDAPTPHISSVEANQFNNYTPLY